MPARPGCNASVVLELIMVKTSCLLMSNPCANPHIQREVRSNLRCPALGDWRPPMQDLLNPASWG
eukprot:scaffold196054_cov15-Tisochrysis_lutea.AAC.1